MSLQIRSLAAALVVVTLTGGAAQALPLSVPLLADGEEAGFLETVWEWVVTLVQPAAVQSKLRLDGSEAGGMMDPDGSMLEAGRFEPGSTDAGGMMDPDGLR